MFKESLGRDAYASSNPDPIQEVTLYKIIKKDVYIATNDLVGPGQQNWEKIYRILVHIPRITSL